MEKCIICGKLGKHLFTVEKRRISSCQWCELSWTENFQQPDYKDYHYDETYDSCRPLFDNAFLRLLHITQKHIKSGNMFEIGSSVGNLLNIFARNGWTVEGVEPSQGAAQIATKKGFKVINGFFEKAKIPENSFDLVIINQTLEHLDDPLLILNKINKILKKEGLVLIGVPNFGSFSAKLLRKKWYYIIPTEHKWHFSPKSLKKLVIKAGFQPIEYRTASGIFDYEYPLQEIWSSFIGLKKRFLSEFFTVIPSYILTKINQGTGLVLIAKKS